MNRIQSIKSVRCGIVTMLLALLAGCQGDDWKVWQQLPDINSLTFWAPRDHGGKPIPVLRRRAGSDPGLTEPGVMLIDSQAELDATGSIRASTLEVDFKRESMVILAVGRQPTGGYWARIEGLQQDGRQVYVHGVVNRPTPDQAVSQGFTYPFDAMVVAKLNVDQLYTDISSATGTQSPD